MEEFPKRESFPKREVLFLRRDVSKYRILKPAFRKLLSIIIYGKGEL
jgi:hypothetical protein